jgi:bla regulator protein blaR1
MTMRVVRGLSFVNLLLSVAVFVILTAPVAFGQEAKVPEWQTSAGGKMAFAVASIHPSKPGEFTYPNFPISNDDSYVAGSNDSFVAGFSVESYIEFAYKLRLSSDQRRAMLPNLPGWVATDAYVIRAKAEGNVTKDQLCLMMQSLLADRFKMVVHFETKEVPVFALTLVKEGLGPSSVCMPKALRAIGPTTRCFRTSVILTGSAGRRTIPIWRALEIPL